MVRLQTIEVIQDGIPATFEKLRAHYPGTAVELHAINRNNIVVEVDKRSIKLKYLSVYYLIHNQFGEPGLVESTEPIEWVINMVQRKADKVYARLQKQHENVLDVARRHQETIVKLNTDSFSLDTVLDLLMSMHQGICPRAFAHWDVEKNAFDYNKQSTLDSFDFIDLAYSKACDLGIEKEFCKHMDSLPTMIEKDWMEGYERRQRLKESKIGKDIMLDEAPELVISLTTSRPWEGIMHLQLHSMLELPTGTLPKGCALATFYLDKLSEYEAAQSYLDMIVYPSKWTLLGDEQYMKTKGWLHVWQVHLQDLQKLHQQGWKIDMYVNSGTKLVDPQLPPIREGSFVSNEPVEELTPVEEVTPDPEPSVAEQEVMQNEVNETREIVPVYVRVRKYKTVQSLELVQNTHDEILQAGEDIVHSIPFNTDIYEFVKKLNERHCLSPRIGTFQDGSVYSDFTSYAQEVYRDGKAVQLVIGEPTQSTPQAETDTVVQDGSLMLVYVGVINDGNGYRSLYLRQNIQDVDDDGNKVYLPTNWHIVEKIGLTDDLDDIILKLNNLYCTKRPDQYGFLLKPAFQGFASRKRKQGYGVVLMLNN